MAGLLSNNPEMRRLQLAEGKPSVKERLADNSVSTNPFSISGFGMNNPELQLIKDPTARSDIQRQAFFKGLGQAGQSLLQNADKSVAQAFGAGAGAFTEGAQEGVTQGLLVNKEREKQRMLKEFEENNKAGWTRGKKEAWDLSQALGDPSFFKTYSDKDPLITKVDINKAKPASVQQFNKKYEETGQKDYSLLEYPATLKTSTADNLNAMRSFDAQVANLLELKFQLNDKGDLIMSDFVEGGGMTKEEYIEKQELFRMMSENAWNRWYNNESLEGSAVADAARNYETRIPKKYTSGPKIGQVMKDVNGNTIYEKKWALPKDRWVDQTSDPAGIGS